MECGRRSPQHCLSGEDTCISEPGTSSLEIIWWCYSRSTEWIIEDLFVSRTVEKCLISFNFGIDKGIGPSYEHFRNTLIVNTCSIQGWYVPLFLKLFVTACFFVTALELTFTASFSIYITKLLYYLCRES